ncbi:MAG TPA: hemerythrin domain-containing protein [Candidatus Binatia bacterium]|nr:hemerythrin domain-containing protein [Candidatus Binatia bacterium]
MRKSGGRSASSGGRDPMAIQLLKQDHRTVEDLFEEFEEAKRPADKRAIAKEICMELTIHSMIEEEIFYPAVKDVVDEEIYGEAHVEHDGAKVLIAEIMASDPSDEFYDARVKVLSEMIKHHVKEEEQRDGMFAQAKSKGKDLDFDEIGEQLQTRKEDLMRLMQRNGIPAPEARTMHGAKVKLGQPYA